MDLHQNMVRLIERCCILYFREGDVQSSDFNRVEEEPRRGSIQSSSFLLKRLTDSLFPGRSRGGKSHCEAA